MRHADAQQVAELVIGLRDGRPLYLSDVADIHRGADLPSQYAWYTAPQDKLRPDGVIAPAVTIAIAKKPGANAADITSAIASRLKVLEASVIPEGIHCCGFAGDKGFTTPELNSHSLRTLKDAVQHCSEGISTSRTCEIGLSSHSGIDYHGLVYLVDRVTRPRVL